MRINTSIPWILFFVIGTIPLLGKASCLELFQSKIGLIVPSSASNFALDLNDRNSSATVSSGPVFKPNELQIVKEMMDKEGLTHFVFFLSPLTGFTAAKVPDGTNLASLLLPVPIPIQKRLTDYAESAKQLLVSKYGDYASIRFIGGFLQHNWKLEGERTSHDHSHLVTKNKNEVTVGVYKVETGNGIRFNGKTPSSHSAVFFMPGVTHDHIRSVETAIGIELNFVVRLDP